MDSMKVTILIVIFLQLPFYAASQTCCSAGTPILSAIDVSVTNADQWQFSLTVEHNSIKDVLPKTIDAREERFSNTALFDVSYGISDRFSATLIIPFVQQNQTFLFGNSDNIRTNGLGDLLALIKYNIIISDLADQNQLAIGYGLKFPSGKSDLRDKNNFVLVPQLQPGTGSWDHILGSYFAKSFRPNPFSIFINLNYRMNGDNNRFQSNGPFSSYHFGNILLGSAGLSYRHSALLDLSLQTRYRHAAKDSFAGSSVPNTGGNWIYLVPALNVNMDPIGFRISTQLPVYRDLSGIQITTSYTLSASIYFFII